MGRLTTQAKGLIRIKLEEAKSHIEMKRVYENDTNLYSVYVFDATLEQLVSTFEGNALCYYPIYCNGNYMPPEMIEDYTIHKEFVLRKVVKNNELHKFNEGTIEEVLAYPYYRIVKYRILIRVNDEKREDITIHIERSTSDEGSDEGHNSFSSNDIGYKDDGSCSSIFSINFENYPRTIKCTLSRLESEMVESHEIRADEQEDLYKHIEDDGTVFWLSSSFAFTINPPTIFEDETDE